MRSSGSMETRNFQNGTKIAAVASAASQVSIFQVETEAQIEQARELFREYGESLGFSLCFQSFDKELAELPGDYAPPGGRLFLATEGEMAAGCIALHRIENDVCEMKRLYVRPAFRGKRLGFN